jgi:hypothetical protein
MSEHGEGSPQAPPPEAGAPEPETPASSENGGSAAHNGAEPTAYMRSLLEVGKLAPWQLARLALGEEPDEIVPSIEAVTFFEGSVAREFEEANPGQSIGEFRQDRAKRRSRRLP